MKRNLLVFLLGAAVGAGGMYLWLSHRHETGLFARNWTRPSPHENPAVAKWAEALQAPGLENFYRVSNNLYRGAQPQAEGMRHLKKMGIRTVVNLRSFHSDQDLLGDTGLAYEHLEAEADDPEEEVVVRFLQIVTDPARTPVFVHCRHGSDRTGLVCAMYRVFVQGWSKPEAIEEMTQGGFGFHLIFDELIEFIEELHLDEVRRRAGLGPPAAATSAAAG